MDIIINKTKTTVERRDMSKYGNSYKDKKANDKLLTQEHVDLN